MWRFVRGMAIRALRADTFGELRGANMPQRRDVQSSKVFIVHGHDHGAKSELEIFLSSLGLEPVVLHRKADGGLTLIEKFDGKPTEITNVHS